MIGTLIVAGSIVFASVFAMAWWLRPALRRAIEAPKHGFAERVRQYDEAHGKSGEGGAPTVQHD